MEVQTVFNRVEKLVPELAFDRKFELLGALPGPKNPDWILGKVLYEIYVRAFSEQGTFNGVTDRLQELKNLGIDVIWLMPVYPIGLENRKGSLGSPYAIRDYFTVNPEYGSEDDFARLVQTAHRLSMKVIIDMVPNHVAPDYVGLKNNPNLIARDKNGNPKRKIADWSDIADLNYENPHTREHIARVMQYWIKEFDVDGYRVDVAGFVPLDFWEWLAPQLRSIKRDLYLLAEWESPQLHKKAFNSTYDWSTLRILRQAFSGNVRLLAEWILAKTEIYPQNSLPLRFLENHDLKRARAVFDGEQLFAALTFVFSLHGVPLVYNGQEIGADTTPSLFEKEPIDWDNKNDRIFQAFKTLIRLRKAHKALGSNKYRFFEAYFDQGVLAYDKSRELRILINLMDKETELDQEIRNGVQDVLFNSQQKLKVKDGRWVLQPYQAMILTI